MSTYRIDVVTSGTLMAPPLHSETFEAASDSAAEVKAREIVTAHVTNPEEEYGVLILVADQEWVADIDVSRDEEDAR